MFNDLLALLKKALWVAGLLLSALVLIQVVEFFLDLYAFHPAAGWGFLGAALLLLLWGGIYLYRSWYLLPRVLNPPALPLDLEQADYHQMVRYCRYLRKYLDRLAGNPALKRDDQEKAREQSEHIQGLLKAHPLLEDLRTTILKTTAEVLDPLLESLQAKARGEIRNSIRDVMLAVTLSPYHSLDVIIVLYRNAGMVIKVAKIFHARPAGAEQLLILRDVLRVVVTLNFLYVGRNLIENLFSHVPFVGRVIDDMGQGIGAGLFTSAAGHAAIRRCAAYTRWNREEEVDTLAAQTKSFLGDVRDIFTKDVVPALKTRLGMEASPDDMSKPGFWDNVNTGIQRSFDATTGAIDTLLVKPATAGGRGLAWAGQAAFKAGAALNPFKRAQGD